MSKYKKRNINSSWFSVVDTDNKLHNLFKKNKTHNTVTTLRKEYSIVLANDELLVETTSNSARIFTYDFLGLSERFLPFFSVDLLFRTTSGFVINERFTERHYFVWKQIPGGYRFILRIWGSLTNLIQGNSTTAPLYYTLQLKLINYNFDTLKQ